MYMGLSGKICRGEQGKERIPRMEVYLICTCEDSIMKPTKHCLIKSGRKRRGMEI
jgi:hypothetical protein